MSSRSLRSRPGMTAAMNENDTTAPTAATGNPSEEATNERSSRNEEGNGNDLALSAVSGSNAERESVKANGEAKDGEAGSGASSETVTPGPGIPSTQHQTRSKNGVKKHAKTHPQEGQAPCPPLDPVSLNRAATTLAAIDERSYSRALLKDANSYLEDLLLPMSFPWAHPIEPVTRAIPRDIDEMYGIISMGSTFESSGVRHARPVKAGLLKPDGMIAATQRSSQAGIVEYYTTFHPSLAQQAAAAPMYGGKRRIDDPSIPGELSLRKFEEVQSRKRQNEVVENSNVKKKLLSFRAGCTSSRTSILDTPGGTVPVLLTAELPIDVQDGKRMRNSVRARELARLLGTYNCKLGQGKPKPDGKKEDRIRVGRARLTWTKPDPTLSAKSFKSMLTGRPVDVGTHRRPRLVKVGVRVNGVLLHASSIAEATSETGFDDALANACLPSKKELPAETRQCVLDPQRLLAYVVKDRTTPRPPGQGLQIHEKFTVSHQNTALTILPPKIECFASQDGLVYTMCAERGKIVSRTTFPPSPDQIKLPKGVSYQDCPSVLADTAAASRRVCAVCWGSSGDMLSCSGCSLTVHRSCYGREIQGAQWTCDPCSELLSGSPDMVKNTENCSIHRWSLSCSVCNSKGGSLVRQEDGRWIHDTCRIWSAADINPPPLCTLCGTGTRPIVRCAGKNCQVMFHPQCAIIVSNAADMRQRQRKKPPLSTQGSEARNVIEDDEFRSTQFRLVQMEVCSPAFQGVKTVPVAFCGYHNPERRADFRGLYPGGLHLNKAMRIPPLYGSSK